ncbi:DUF4395 domain-containing protein [Fictibacillus fluitans]|uniref:DUF4395 domain-containing protein n=1 Tax=Fictibacillus fluitans TaxID=3058422 RepID=A0ABT8HQU8_9BACL|nr:DUF4395 domain-containing protein [Fictibacillus sp. NE201]MDN4522890.1 DUF4395 domain-containing protein [Fictibacillus sp. NE201]
MREHPVSIPRPLVKLNQWFIVLSVAAFWITGAHWLLLLPLAAGLSGLLFRYNPIMQLGKQFLIKPLPSYIPEDWDQQQFNQKIAVLCLFLGFISYQLQWHTAAYVFTAMVFAAALIAILGFCIGCFIRFQWQQYKYRKQQANS